MTDRPLPARRRAALIEAVGFVLLVAGLTLWSLPLALVVAGAALVAAGNLPTGGRR